MRKGKEKDFISSIAHVYMMRKKWDKWDKKASYKKSVSIDVCIIDEKTIRSKSLDSSLPKPLRYSRFVLMPSLLSF